MSLKEQQKAANKGALDFMKSIETPEQKQQREKKTADNMDKALQGYKQKCKGVIDLELLKRQYAQTIGDADLTDELVKKFLLHCECGVISDAAVKGIMESFAAMDHTAEGKEKEKDPKLAFCIVVRRYAEDHWDNLHIPSEQKLIVE